MEQEGSQIRIEELKEIKQITPYIWEIPKTHKSGMRVPARIITSQILEELIKRPSD